MNRGASLNQRILVNLSDEIRDRAFLFCFCLLGALLSF